MNEEAPSLDVAFSKTPMEQLRMSIFLSSSDTCDVFAHLHPSMSCLCKI